eukprot:PhM_4_TR2870/c0_g1_i1/m.96931
MEVQVLERDRHVEVVVRRGLDQELLRPALDPPQLFERKGTVPGVEPQHRAVDLLHGVARRSLVQPPGLDLLLVLHLIHVGHEQLLGGRRRAALRFQLGGDVHGLVATTPIHIRDGATHWRQARSFGRRTVRELLTTVEDGAHTQILRVALGVRVPAVDAARRPHLLVARVQRGVRRTAPDDLRGRRPRLVLLHRHLHDRAQHHRREDTLRLPRLHVERVVGRHPEAEQLTHGLLVAGRHREELEADAAQSIVPHVPDGRRGRLIIQADDLAPRFVRWHVHDEPVPCVGAVPDELHELRGVDVVDVLRSVVLHKAALCERDGVDVRVGIYERAGDNKNISWVRAGGKTHAHLHAAGCGGDGCRSRGCGGSCVCVRRTKNLGKVVVHDGFYVNNCNKVQKL